MTTRMFVWRSEALRNYGPGRIAALGTNPEEARVNARAAFQAYARSERYWWNADGSVFDWCQEEHDEFFQKVEADLQNDPEEMSALIVPGSE